MRKKGLNLAAALATLVAMALGPIAASSADVVWQCSPGMKDHHYCTKVIHCEKSGYRHHDCRRENHDQ